LEIRAQAERGSGISLKLFGFIAESVFTFIPESRSRSSGFPISSKRRLAASGFVPVYKLLPVNQDWSKGPKHAYEHISGH
jgi:hypothetical protein